MSRNFWMRRELHPRGGGGEGVTGARLGQVGVRPATFETVGYDEVAMIRKFGQNVIYAKFSDVEARTPCADDDPRVQDVIAAIRGERGGDDRLGSLPVQCGQAGSRRERVRRTQPAFSDGRAVLAIDPTPDGHLGLRAVWPADRPRHADRL